MSSPAPRASKVVLITGCSEGGIGFHLCEEFARKGCTVFATARKVEKMAGLADHIQKLRMDVTSDEDILQAVQEVIAHAGRVDVLVNNAGVESAGALLEMPMSAVTSTFDTNVFGAIRVAKVVAPHMITQKSGLIVNISSIASGVPTPWSAPYNASKAALNAITDSLDMELRPFNVNVMLLIAGLVTSNIADNHAAHIVRPSADSPYAPFTDKIVGRLYTSQEECVATAAFARTVVKQALRERPPSYLVLGGNTVPFRILQWLPRKVVLGLSWTVFSDKVGLLRWIKKLGSMFD